MVAGWHDNQKSQQKLTKNVLTPSATPLWVVEVSGLWLPFLENLLHLYQT